MNNKNLVMLTKAALGKKCRFTFLHSLVGIHMIPNSVHYVACTGMKFGLGVKLYLSSLFHQTSSRHVLPVVDIMKVTTEKEYLDLKALSTGSKKKVNCYAVLTPSLAEAA